MQANPTKATAMNPARKKKLLILLSCLLLIAIGTSFILMSLSQSINLFLTPTQVVGGEAPEGKTIRIGGLVSEGSLERSTGTQMNFIVTDTANEVTVYYDGILPDLFREGKAVVVTGSLNKANIFVADEVLAKHDENYIPAEAAEAIMQAQKPKQQ